MKYYKCLFHELVNKVDHYTARLTLSDTDKERGFVAGDIIQTSRIKSIDFVAGVIVTQNSVYLFK